MAKLLGLCLIFFVPAQAKELVFAHVIYRHGARSPSRIYPNDKYNDSYWKDGRKQLTQNGMRGQYQLGQFLRKRYIEDQNFLGKIYSRDELFVRSTDLDRALQSAAANLAGLYPPQGHQVWKSGLDWQPIPIHCDSADDQDLLLKPTSVDCPNYDKAHENYVASLFKPYNDMYQDFFQFFKNKTGLQQSVDIVTVTKYGYGPIISEIADNLTQPNWVLQQWNGTGGEKFGTVWSLILEMKRIVRTSQFNWQDLAKYIGGYLLNDILTRLQEKAAAPKLRPTKMVMYSSHQGTLMGLLYTMGIANDRILPFSTCIMIELYKEGSQHLVEVYLRNSSDQFSPYRLIVPACKSQSTCLLDTVVQSYANSVYKSRSERDEACGLPNANAGKAANNRGQVIAIAVLAVLLAVLLAIVIFLVVKLQNRRRYR